MFIGKKKKKKNQKGGGGNVWGKCIKIPLLQNTKWQFIPYFSVHVRYFSAVIINQLFNAVF